jgi:hypothetical protein
METRAVSKRLENAVIPQRSLLFYTATATLPVILIVGVILLTNIRGTRLVILTILGAIASAVGLSRLLYELTLDVAGAPEYKLPIWSVFYLIVYVISFFTFVFFAMHLESPGYHFGGFSKEGARFAFVDALYTSMWYYIGSAPDSSITVGTQRARMLTVIEGLISMFINVVIITKFVSAF